MDLQRAQLEVNTRIVETQMQLHQTLKTQQQLIQAMNNQAHAINELSARVNALWVQVNNQS